MANPPKPWKAEYAKSFGSSCEACKTPIDIEKLCLGKMVQATQLDGFMPVWNHAQCILKNANQIKSVDDVEGIELLRCDDQQMIREYIEGGGPPKDTTENISAAVVAIGIEVSQTSRATCKQCRELTRKGEIRMSSKADVLGAKRLAWHHVDCHLEMWPSTQIEKLSGWDRLLSPDQEALSAFVKKCLDDLELGIKVEGKEDDKQSTPWGDEYKKYHFIRDQNPKFVDSEEDDPVRKAASDLKRKRVAQSKDLWALRADLKKHVYAYELRELLELNGQDSSVSKTELQDCCVDGMLFGPLGRCPLCSCSLCYSGGMYRCLACLSAWSNCFYSTIEPERLEKIWEIPDETSSQYLCKWSDSPRAKRQVRLMPPQSSNLSDLRVALAGYPEQCMGEWKIKLEAVVGSFHARIKKDTNCFVVGGMLDAKEAKMKRARKMNLPIVRENYLVDCFKSLKKLPFDKYSIESSMVTVKVKGRNAVPMQDSGRIPEDGRNIYNTASNMPGLSSGFYRWI